MNLIMTATSDSWIPALETMKTKNAPRLKQLRLVFKLVKKKTPNSKLKCAMTLHRKKRSS